MKTILIVDDDRLVLRALSRTLTSTFVVTRSEGVGEALGLIADGHRFDVILCDMLLGDGSGRDFYEGVLRYCPPQADRVLFLSGLVSFDDPEQPDAFAEATVGRHMAKPCSTAELVARTRAVAESPDAIAA